MRALKGVKLKVVARKSSLIFKNDFSRMYNEGYAVSVQPPSRRIVNIETSGELANYWDYDWDSPIVNYHGNFFLSFPHAVFSIHYRNVNQPGKKLSFQLMGLRVAFATKAKPKKIYVPPLFNIGSDLRVCIILPDKHFSNVEDMMQVAIAAFWATEFNDGMFDAFMDHYTNGNSMLRQPKIWQKKTKANLQWKPTARSMKEYKESFVDFCKPPFIGGNNWDNGDGNYDEDYDE